MRFLLTMILLTICVYCRSVLKIECKKTEDGKDYVEKLPVLLEIDDNSVFKLSWNEKKGEEMPDMLKWNAKDFCDPKEQRYDFLTMNFSEISAIKHNIRPLIVKTEISNENIYYYDLIFYQLEWDKTQNYRNEKSPGETTHYFYFSIPLYTYPDKTTKSFNMFQFEKTNAPNWIIAIEVPIDKSTENKLVLI